MIFTTAWKKLTFFGERSKPVRILEGISPSPQTDGTGQPPPYLAGLASAVLTGWRSDSAWNTPVSACPMVNVLQHLPE